MRLFEKTGKPHTRSPAVRVMLGFVLDVVLPLQAITSSAIREAVRRK